jgi:hypothetical protein
VTNREGPPWLSDLQRALGATLRAPLDRSTGTLRVVPASYEPRAREAVAAPDRRAADDRLAVYNRQYWFRLFGALQHEMRLTSALVGAWSFNGFAAQFLAAHPPRGWDLGRAADGFADFLEREAPSAGIAPDGVKRRLPRRALVQAARVDQAFRAAASAPPELPFHPSAADAERLPRARLVPSRTLSIVEEAWPLVAMAGKLPRAPGNRALELPPPHDDGVREVAIWRRDATQEVRPLARLEAQLLRRLLRAPLSEALAGLERELPADDRATVEGRVSRWLAESVRRGFWIGLEP